MVEEDDIISEQEEIPKAECHGRCGLKVLGLEEDRRMMPGRMEPDGGSDLSEVLCSFVAVKKNTTAVGHFVSLLRR